jgi:hypothetical protein
MPKHQKLHPPNPSLQDVVPREFRSCPPVIDVPRNPISGTLFHLWKLNDYVSHPGEKDDFLENFELYKTFPSTMVTMTSSFEANVATGS